MANKKGSPGAEYQHYISAATPSDTDVEVGSLYVDKDDGKVYRCTSVGPIVFTELATHTQSHDHSAAGDGTSLVPATLRTPNGAGGTLVDAAGEITTDTTSRTLNFYDGTAEVVLNPVESKAFFIETPVATDDFAIWRTDVAITLIEVHYLCIGGTNWVGQLQEMNGNGGVGVDVQTTDTTATAGTDAEVTSFSNAAIDAGDWIGIKTTSISGTPTSLHVTFYFRQDA